MSSADHPVTKFISPSAWSLIEPRFSPFAKKILADLVEFVQTECIPAEAIFNAQLLEPSAPPSAHSSSVHSNRKDILQTPRWNHPPPIIEELKAKARKRGLWNLFLSKAHYPEVGVDLTNLEYAVMAEIMGHSPHIAPESTNCAAPDTGNMEVFARYGNKEQKEKYLKPLLEGKIRSSFAMTEFGVASSDATNLRGSIRKDGDFIVINAHKWWISGAGDPRNSIHILIGLSDPSNPSPHLRHTIVLIPPNTPGVSIVRPLSVFGYDDAPEGHCEVRYDNVRVNEKEALVGGWGRGFEIIQGRLGPGRIHHCMRSIGNAERALGMMLERVTDPGRKTFGKLLADHGTVMADIAKSRCEIDAARLLVLSAAHQIDCVRAKGAMKDIGMAKYVVPSMALKVLDRAMQSFGAEGISQDTPLAFMYANLRTLRYADGPDAVHLLQIGKQELKRVEGIRERSKKRKEKELALQKAESVRMSKL